ncbi:MAG TPA: DUF4190 domain-containing protein [Actinomycetota bacterium]|nr:DUF4190 domain-containing protein [Actinomycetota bacterium]
MDERPGLSGPAPQAVSPPPASPAARTNGKAIASLVLGIVGVTGIPFVASVVAIILGYMARTEIAQRGEEGRGLATAGIILGWVGVLLAIAGALLVGVFIATTTSVSVAPAAT